MCLVCIALQPPRFDWAPGGCGCPAPAAMRSLPCSLLRCPPAPPGPQPHPPWWPPRPPLPACCPPAVRPHAGGRLGLALRHARGSGGQQRCANNEGGVYEAGRGALRSGPARWRRRLRRRTRRRRHAPAAASCHGRAWICHPPTPNCRHPLQRSSAHKAVLGSPNNPKLNPNTTLNPTPNRAGILFSEAALKGSHFVQLCAQRRVPLLFLQASGAGGRQGARAAGVCQQG